jgi:hypothetical protein
MGHHQQNIQLVALVGNRQVFTSCAKLATAEAISIGGNTHIRQNLLFINNAS